MTQSGAELAVPEAARAALREAVRGSDYFWVDEEAVGEIRAIAAPVVAAELRRIAEAIREEIGNAVRQLGPSDADQGGLDAADYLDHRADELDGGAS